MVKAAFAACGDRVAPVFDTARRIRLVTVQSGRIVMDAQETLPDGLPVQKALALAGLGVETLVCGAISRSLQTLIAAYGIRVIPFVAGELDEVLRVWMNPRPRWDAFAMPGCCGRGRRCRQGGVRVGERVGSGREGRCVTAGMSGVKSGSD